jgi:hypothetical protein
MVAVAIKETSAILACQHGSMSGPKGKHCPIIQLLN